jgi:hypothetical protein
MKNILFFITHKTLNEEHAELSFKSISNQNYNKTFDVMYIYNTHSNELSNQYLLNLVEKYNLYKFFNKIEIFPYDESTHKSLGADIFTIKEFCKSNFDENDRILLLKSDTILSVNFFDDILDKLSSDRPIYFVAPFICAKRRVSNEIIMEYSKRTEYIQSDDITFFVEDRYQSNNNDFKHRNIDVTDHSILFTACYVIRDFSCHFLSIKLFDLVRITNQSWGGVWFSALEPYFIETDRSFVIHKYHDIISENRSEDRGGSVKDWLNS